MTVLRSEATRSIWYTAEYCDNAAVLSACSEVCCPALSDVPSYSALRWLADRRPQAEGRSWFFVYRSCRRGVYNHCRRKLTILFDQLDCKLHYATYNLCSTRLCCRVTTSEGPKATQAFVTEMRAAIFGTTGRLRPARSDRGVRSRHAVQQGPHCATSEHNAFSPSKPQVSCYRRCSTFVHARFCTVITAYTAYALQAAVYKLTQKTRSAMCCQLQVCIVPAPPSL